MDLNLKGKIVGITGGADRRGLGFAITCTLLEEGCICFIIDIDAEKLKDAKRELSSYGHIEAFCGDVSNSQQMSSIIKEAVAQFGHIDVYINNAGICPNASIESMDEELWDKCMAINLKSIFLSGKLVIPHMPKGGTIINAASFVSLIPTAGLSVYSASKAGVLTLTRVMAAEFGSKGIRVNCYIPGLMDTKMNQERIDTMADRLKEQIASATFGIPQDVANAVAFLASDRSSYINGTYIEISGGKFCTQNPDYSWKNM